MAYAVPSGTHANLISAHNRAHQEAHGVHYVHNDRPPVNLSGAEDVLTSSPTTLTQAVDTFTAAMAIHNRHLPEYSTPPIRYYAHIANDTTNLMAMSALSSGATYEAAHLALLIALTQEESTRYEAHRLESGGDYHPINDTTNVLGTTATLTTFKDVAERLNLLKLLINLHMANLTYHGAATTAITAANATEGDIDSMIALANDIRTKWGTHLASAAAHTGAAGDDVANVITGGAVTGLPSALATFADGFFDAHNDHVGSTTYHNFADALNVLTYSTPTTFAAFIAAAAEVYTKQRGHQYLAPISAAVRI